MGLIGESQGKGLKHVLETDILHLLVLLGQEKDIGVGVYFGIDVILIILNDVLAHYGLSHFPIG